MKTSIISKHCNAIWYLKITTIIPPTFLWKSRRADFISHDFCKLNLPRNRKQKSDHNRSAIFDEKSVEEAELLQNYTDGWD